VRVGGGPAGPGRRLEAQVGDAERLAYELLPPVLEEMRQGNLEDAVMPPELDRGEGADRRLTAAHRKIVSQVLYLLREKELQRDSSKRAIQNIAARILTGIHILQKDIVDLEFKYDDVKTMDDLFRLEHRINVTGRFATALAVIGGGSPLRQWPKPVTLHDVMRAGAGPIQEYRRVKQEMVIDVGVVAHAVEPMIMLFAEFLDNATRYSPPSCPVVMSCEEVASGIEVSIEDKGTGLTAEKRRFAEFLLRQGVDGTGGVDIEDLGESARLGLRVAGILADQLGVLLSLRPSTCGGVRVVVFIPNALLTHSPEDRWKRLPPLRPEPNWPTRRPVADDEPQYEVGANGLPQRSKPIRRAWTPPEDEESTTKVVPHSRLKPLRDLTPEERAAHEREQAELAERARREAEERRRRAAEESRPPGAWVDEFYAGVRAAEEARAAAEAAAEEEQKAKRRRRD
jgi:hypothetical protein